jgi:small redox-active disulfide protein 2
MMEIKILGSGCPKCKRLESVTREVVDELGLSANFTKVTSMSDIMNYDIMTTPALVVDEVVLSYGRIPSKDEIRCWLENGS